MNEEALKDSYDSAVSNGYTGSPEEYVELLNTTVQTFIPFKSSLLRMQKDRLRKIVLHQD